MNSIRIDFIPSAQQRYATWGDWYYDEDGTLVIKVSNDVEELPTPQHQFLIALHELVEVKLCEVRGITQKMVDEFDMSDEVVALCEQNEELEPGDLPDAPYRKEHRFAMLLEHLMAKEFGFDDYGTVR